jgi:hypothetical protein
MRMLLLEGRAKFVEMIQKSGLILGAQPVREEAEAEEGEQETTRKNETVRIR